MSSYKLLGTHNINARHFDNNLRLIMLILIFLSVGLLTLYFFVGKMSTSINLNAENCSIIFKFDACDEFEVKEQSFLTWAGVMKLY